MKYLLPLSIVVASFASCKKEEPALPLVPEIALVSMSAQEVTSFEDRITIRFSYKDGDGDIGQADPDAYTLWVKDARLSTARMATTSPLWPRRARKCPSKASSTWS
jgi:hypothetical protein